jgi:hypothetical protein
MALTRLALSRNIGEKDNAGRAGKRRMSSTSNTKKIIATKKNRMENGKRAECLGLNPHSKGLDFSRSERALNPKLMPSITKIMARVKTAAKLIKSPINNSGQLILW